MASTRSRWVVAALAGGLIVPAPALAQVPEGAALPTAEEHTTTTLPEASPHWAYIVDPIFPHLVATKVWIVDGDALDVVGMANGGYLANAAIAPDNSEFYVAETYWSRGTRGDRADMVTTYDAKTLEPTGEVLLPEGRFLVVSKKYMAAVMPDGRHVLSYNMAPATSVSVVDVENQAYVADIEIPGCALVYPMGPTRFASICADGSFITVDFADAQNPSIERGEPWFDAENDPVFEHPGFSQKEGQAYFVTYGGMVYPVDFTGDQPQVGQAWSLLGDDERGTWWPGGWQLTSYHPGTNRLFVQMHEGAKWSHKDAGSEIWVFDVEAQERVQRIELVQPAWSSMVTQDDQPLLFVVDGGGTTSVYDATTYEHKGDVAETGISPHVIVVTGE